MSQLDEFSRRVYSGRSSEVREVLPGEPDAPTLEKAVRAAYEKGIADSAKQGKQGPFAFRVVDIVIEGSNPPSDYKVDLADI